MSYDDEVTGVISAPRRWPLGVAAAVLAGIGIGAVVLTADGDTDKPSAAASPTPEPLATSSSPAPEPAPTPDPSDTAVPSPTPTPSPSPATTATVSVTRAPAPRPTRPAATRPAQAAGYPARGLVVELVGEPIAGDPPQVRFRIRVRDNDGNEVDGTIEYGDGTRQVFSRRPAVQCASPTPGPAPAGYRPAPIDRRFTVTHAYQSGGRFTVTVTATTGRQCFGTPRETDREQVIVTVPPRPSPAPTTASPSPIGSASPTAPATPTPPASEAPRP